MKEALDVMGKPITVGEVVAFPTGRQLDIGTVTKVTNKMVRVKNLMGLDAGSRYHSDVIQIQGPEATKILLSRRK